MLNALPLAPWQAKKAAAKPPATPNADAPVPAEAVRASTEESEQVVQPAAATSPPALPADDFSGDAVPEISRIIAWAKPKLEEMAIKKKWMLAGGNLEGLAPLMWSEAAAKESSTYKEMWDMKHMATALRREKLYEAGGVVHWIHLVPDSGYVHVTWPQVVAARCLLQPRSISTTKDRILWPMLMETYINSQNLPDADSNFPCGLRLLHGHAVLFAWWTLVYAALREHNETSLQLLWETALTATLLVRVLDSSGEIAVAFRCHFLGG